MNHVCGGIIEDDEEHMLSCVLPWRYNKHNTIFGGFCCVHYAFYTQRPVLDERGYDAKYMSSSVSLEFRRKQFIPLYIPPYSPQYNPIEIVFSKMKTLWRNKCFQTVPSHVDVQSLLDEIGPFHTCFQHCIAEAIESDLRSRYHDISTWQKRLQGAVAVKPSSASR
jgi:hypothetical protein